MTETADHWRQVYATKGADTVSWYQPEATASLALIDAAGLKPDTAAVDIGAGASPLTAALLARGWRDLTVLDIADSALAVERAALGEQAGEVDWVAADVRDWRPMRTYGLWHDRAVFHFLTTPQDRELYRRTLDAGLKSGGRLVMGTFGEHGPQRCSGLPVQRWTARGLAEELGPAFALRRTFDETHLTPGGAAQLFTWTLFERLV